MIKTFALFAVAALGVVASPAHNITLEEVYGEVHRVDSMDPWHKRSTTRQTRSDKYFASRTPENCDFPLEIYILQDNTASFQDDFLQMKDVQLPLLISAMETNHPGSEFGIMSFRDKPIWSLGEPSAHDYCQRFESPINPDASLITAVYDRLFSNGGGDPSECQFGGLVAASQSETPGWGNPDAVKLIVLSTDAPPHFADDGLNAYGMIPFDGTFDEANADSQCLEQYYPSPEQVKDALIAREAYLATIVFDGEWWSGLPSRSWEWFNSYIGQTDEFVEPLGNNSTTFFESLSVVIQTIMDIECGPQSTSVPASAETHPETFTTPMESTSTIGPAITRETTEGHASTEEHVCPPCPEEPCECQTPPPRPDECEETVICDHGVYINIGFAPKDFDLHIDGEDVSL